MSQVAGQTKWGGQGEAPVDTGFEPIPAGEYTGVLRSSGAEIAKSQGDEKEGPEAKLPYVGKVYFEIPSITTAAGAARRVYASIFCHADPDKNGGPSMAARADGLRGLLYAIGQDPEFDVLTNEVNGKHYVNPAQVRDFLKELDGTEVGLNVKVEPASKGYSAKNKITKFFSVGDVPMNGAEEHAIEEPAEEPIPAPKPMAKKPAPPPAKKPVAKVAAKKR